MADPLLLAGMAVSFEFARQDGLQPVPSQGFVSGQTEATTVAAPSITGWKRAGAMSPEKRDHKWSNWLAFDFDLDGLATFLREQHPEKCAEHVAALTHSPVHTVRKWLAGQARPGCAALLRLVCVYGPDVLAAMFRDPPDWLHAATRDRAQAHAIARVEVLRERVHPNYSRGAP